MGRKIGVSCIFCALIILGACAASPPINIFSRTYHEVDSGLPIAASGENGTPATYRGTDIREDTRKAIEAGYVPLGYSDFTAAPQNLDDLTEQAETVDAVMVIYYSQYAGSVSGVLPLFTPDIHTSTTNTQGTINPYYNPTNFSATSTTTAYGSNIEYFPYTINRYTYFASYWAKGKPPIFGAMVRDLNDSERREINSNKGAIITLIINNSPAFNADLLAGDILTKIDGEKIISAHGFIDKLNAFAGEEVSITYWRNGLVHEKTVLLNNAFQ